MHRTDERPTRHPLRPLMALVPAMLLFAACPSTGTGPDDPPCGECAGVCEDGVCVLPDDPCAEVACVDPPEAHCEGPMLSRAYGAGTCDDGACEYAFTDTECPLGCDPLTGRCAGCTDECAGPTAQRCTGGQRSACELGADGCFQWAPAVDCPTGRCADATECEACDDECALVGETLCADGQLATCFADEGGCLKLGAPVACETGLCADAASCATCTGDCSVEGASQCTGGTVRTCRRDALGCLAWSAGESCPSGSCGSAEFCAGCVNECETASATECWGSGLRICSPDANGCLVWSDVSVCADFETCTDGVCEVAPPPVAVVISELCYDSAGGDTNPGNTLFVELAAPGSTSLDGFSIRGINGSGGAPYNVIDLTGLTMPSDGYFVVAHPDAAAAVLAEADLTTTAVDYQNGPDSVQLLWHGAVVDAVGYGTFAAGETFAGEGTPAVDVVAGESLTRDERNSDTDDNGVDFTASGVPSPGAAPSSCPDVCPAEDATSCASGELRTCLLGTDGCLSWSAPVTCEDGFCTDAAACGECRSTCDAEGATSCSAGELRTCQADVNGCLNWSAPTACADGVCADAARCGTCVDECSSGATRCDDLQSLSTCGDFDADGCLEWGAPTACGASESCLNGGCVAGCVGCAGTGPGDAILATPGTPVTATAAPAGASTWFVLQVTESWMYRITASELSPYSGTNDGVDVTIYGPGSSDQLASRSSSGAAVTVELQSAWSGLVYVEVKPYYANASGDFTLTVESLGPNDHGDDAAGATVIAADGVPVPGTLEIRDIDDWLRFDVVEGHFYQVTVSALDPYTGTYSGIHLRLYRADGTTLTRERYSSSGDVMVDFLAADSLHRYVRVEAYSSTSRGDYTVTVRDLGTNDHGDEPADATVIAADGVAVPGTLEIRDGEDWLRFPVVDGHFYQVTVTALDPCTGAYRGIHVRLYREDGTTLVRERSSSNGDVTVDFLASNSLHRYVRVEAYVGDSRGDYTVSVRDLGANDHGDEPADATVIAADGVAVPGTLEIRDGEDWLRFPVVDGHFYQVTVTALDPCTGAYRGVHVRLYREDGTTVTRDRSSSNGDVMLDFQASNSLHRYVRVEAYVGDSRGDYTVSVRDLGVNDHGDEPADATVIAADGAAVPGTLEIRDGEDWLRFPVVDGHFYQVTVTALDPYTGLYRGVHVRLYREDGTTLTRERSSSNGDVTVDFQASNSLNRYVRVEAYVGDSRGDYTVTVRDLGTNDHGDTAAQATPVVADGTSTAGLIEVTGSEDWFRFEAVAGTAYTVSVSALTRQSGSGDGTALWIYEGDGSVYVASASSASYGASKSIVASATGTLWVRVAAYYSNAVGSYTLTLSSP